MGATLVALTSLAAITVPLAHAADEGDLKKRQRSVEGQIDDAAQDLAEASRQASRADRTLAATEQRLATARAALGDAQSRLSEAQTRDAQLQTELEEAEAALVRANAAYAASVEEAEQQRGVVRDGVMDIYTNGDPRLRALGSLMESATLTEVEDRRLADQVITGRQTFAYDRLEEIEGELLAERAEVERTRGAVEVKRQEAAAHLTSMQGLVAETAAAQARVEGAVTEARTARRGARAAQARDRAILRALEQREARIKDKLQALARRQASKAGYTGNAGGFLDYPVDGYITSPYGYRTHPIYGYYSLHNGTDFGAPGGCGTPLVASAGGTVIDTYYDSVYGNRLYLAVGNVNGKNLVLVYNHLTDYRVSEGDRVERGDVVGTMGTTGWSTGCHLHFTVMANGNPVDPMPYL